MKSLFRFEMVFDIFLNHFLTSKVLPKRFLISRNIVKRNGWSLLTTSQILSNGLKESIKIDYRVCIHSFLDLEMNSIAVFLVKIRILLFLWYSIFNLSAKHQTCLISPASRNIFYRISTTSQKN